jgi:hypothetical protein
METKSDLRTCYFGDSKWATGMLPLRIPVRLGGMRGGIADKVNARKKALVNSPVRSMKGRFVGSGLG